MNGVKILTKDGFRPFVRIDKKIAKTFVITFDDDTELVCSDDHRFVEDGKTISASDLEIGIVLGGKKVIDVDDGGEREVYTPVEVEGHRYVSDGIEHHNCSFLGSTSTLLDGETLDGLVPIDPLRVDLTGDLLVYEDPVPGGLYVMGVDCAMGVAADYSTFQILRIKSKDEIYQAACYNNNTIRPMEYAKIVDEYSVKYNQAMMIVENNDCGRELVNTLIYDIGNNNIIHTDKRGLGTRATHDSKLDACMLLKRYCETHKLQIHDMLTIQQLGRFEKIGDSEVYKGAKGSHDDMVSSLYWAVYCLSQPEIDIENVSSTQTIQHNDYVLKPIFLDKDMSQEDFWSDFN